MNATTDLTPHTNHKPPSNWVICAVYRYALHCLTLLQRRLGKLELTDHIGDFASSRFIFQRSNKQLVLTVTAPPLGNDSFSLDYTPAKSFEGAAVVVAHRKSCANGNANQLWRYDPITGLIEALAADTTNRGTTYK